MGGAYLPEVSLGDSYHLLAIVYISFINPNVCDVTVAIRNGCRSIGIARIKLVLLETTAGVVAHVPISIIMAHANLDRNLSEIKDQFDDIVKVIVNTSALLNFSVITRNKALLLYHYFKRCIGDILYEPYIVAAACLSLSIKFNDEPIEISVLILTIFDVLERPIDNILSTPSKEGEDDSTIESDNEFEVMQKSLTIMESLTLRMLEFCVDQQLAHDYLLYFMNDFREKFVNLNIWDVLLETTFKMASDIYLTSKCLKYKPEEIAASVIEFSLIILGVTTQEFANEYREKWFKILSEVPTSTKINLFQDIFITCEVNPVAYKSFMDNMIKYSL